jgi:hypothetical protein
MLQVAENIKDNWILRAVIIYAALLWIMTRTGIWEPAWTRVTVAGFLLLVSASGLLCLRIFSSLEDRNFLLARLTYTLGPCLFLLLVGPPLLEILPGPAIARDIQFFLLVFLAIVWYQISVPFVRTWMRDSPNPEKLFRIERKLSNHVTLSEIMDEEPFISSRTYYAFVTGLLSFILVFALAVLSEILGAHYDSLVERLGPKTGRNRDLARVLRSVAADCSILVPGSIGSDSRFSSYFCL